MNDITTGIEARALHAMQRTALAYHCPAGHGPLHVGPDTTSPSGLSLGCTTCGHRVAADTALIGLAIARTTTGEFEVENRPVVQLADGAPPRGLRPDGTVRTTGWLQIAKFPVSSGLWAVLAAFFLTLPTAPWVTFAAMPLGYIAWKLGTTVWFPASRAVNAERKPAGELSAGHLIRLYGSAGPVGQISSVSADAQGRIRLRFAGGLELLRPVGQRLWRVDLRN